MAFDKSTAKAMQERGLQKRRENKAKREQERSDNELEDIIYSMGKIPTYTQYTPKTILESIAYELFKKSKKGNTSATLKWLSLYEKGRARAEKRKK